MASAMEDSSAAIGQPATAFEAKRAMRLSMREQIAAMSPEAREGESTAVCAAVRAIEAWQRAERVLLYASIEDGEGELDVSALLGAGWDEGRVVCLPRVDWERGTMEAVRVRGREPEVEVRRHGVPEPVDGEIVDAWTLDVILVPGLAFDAHGTRLGRGAGFYDRYLGDLMRSPSVRKPELIGVCFGCQVVEHVPREAHDVFLDEVVSGEHGLLGVGTRR